MTFRDALTWIVRSVALLCLVGLSSMVVQAVPSSAPSTLGAPVLKWQKGGCQTTWCRTGWYASPAVADLDSDGHPDVIWTDYRVVAVNGADGSDKWVVANPGGGRGWPGVAVADLDGDGHLDVVTAHSGGWIGVLKANGAALTGWPVQVAPGSELRSLAVGAVDGGGPLQVLVCATRSSNQWFLLNADGTTRAGWPLQVSSSTVGYAAGCYNENVGLADLNGDGKLEMIGPSDVHYVTAYKPDGTTLRANSVFGTVGGQNKPWGLVGFNYYASVEISPGYANCSPGPPLQPRPNFADSAPSFADMDGDGTTEILIVGNQHDCRTSPYTDLYQTPYILKADRTRWSNGTYDWTTLPAPDGSAAPLSENYNVIENSVPNPVAADLDGDGRKEFLYSSYDGRMHAYWLDRTEHGSWPYAVTRPSDGFIRFASEPIVADLDNNGHAEVIFTTWTQKDSNAAGQLIILNYDGTLFYAVDLPRSAQAYDGALGAPTLAHLDIGADYQVVVGTINTGLVAYTLPGSSNARILWGTGRGSVLRQGRAICGIPVAAPVVIPTPVGPARIYLPLIAAGC
ncbi:MAG: VCBS repeat-containing protein [Chloroflexi bacterium]|nr:VCBS repeat-containing protein [Chloroflexota bacterium]